MSSSPGRKVCKSSSRWLPVLLRKSPNHKGYRKKSHDLPDMCLQDKEGMSMTYWHRQQQSIYRPGKACMKPNLP